MKYLLVISIGVTSMFLVACSAFDPAQFPITNPQYVIAATEPRISIESVKIDGKNVVIAPGSKKILLSAPRPQLAGIGAIDFSFTGANVKGVRYWVGATIFIPRNGKTDNLKLFPISIGADEPPYSPFSMDKGFKTELWIEDCRLGGLPYENESEYPEIDLDPSGPIILGQRTKHATFQGIFSVKSTSIPASPYMICEGSTATGKLVRNPAPPAIIEIKGLHIDIDTDLTYEWCSKGAKCYYK